jgi:hypothetical protein
LSVGGVVVGVAVGVTLVEVEVPSDGALLVLGSEVTGFGAELLLVRGAVLPWGRLTVGTPEACRRASEPDRPPSWLAGLTWPLLLRAACEPVG